MVAARGSGQFAVVWAGSGLDRVNQHAETGRRVRKKIDLNLSKGAGQWSWGRGGHQMYASLNLLMARELGIGTRWPVTPGTAGMMLLHIPATLAIRSSPRPVLHFPPDRNMRCALCSCTGPRSHPPGLRRTRVNGRVAAVARPAAWSVVRLPQGWIAMRTRTGGPGEGGCRPG